MTTNLLQGRIEAAIVDGVFLMQSVINRAKNFLRKTFPVEHVNIKHGKPKFLLIGMPAWDIKSPFFALAYVSSIIQKAGWECKIVDMNIEIYNRVSEDDQKAWSTSYVSWQHDESFLLSRFKKYRKYIKKGFLDLIKHDTYDLVGFSVNMQTRYFSLRAAELFASLKTEIPILFGGPECFPMEYGNRFLTNSSHYNPDIILQGEAEIALVKFLKEFGQTRNYKTSVQGFAFKDNGEIIANGESVLPNLKAHAIRADYSQFDFSLYAEPWQITSFFSRGCVNRCAFCNERNNFKRFRIRDAENVLQEIKDAVKYVAKYAECRAYVFFADSIFNGNVRALCELCDVMIESRIDVHWGAPVSFSKSMDRAVLEKMYQSGCRYLFWGLESASQNVLNFMGKRYTITEAKKSLADAIDLGIENELAIVTGFPGETPEDLISTAMFILEYKEKKYVRFPYVVPIEIKVNSLLYSNFADYGIEKIDRYYWYTTDKRNDYYVRYFRFFILYNIIFNSNLSFQNCLHLDYIHKLLDFNALPLASEIASILYMLGIKGQQEKKSWDFLENWQGKDIVVLSQDQLRYWHPQKMPNDLILDNWFNKDKNSDGARTQIIQFLMESFQQVALQLRECQYVNGTSSKKSDNCNFTS